MPAKTRPRKTKLRDDPLRGHRLLDEWSDTQWTRLMRSLRLSRLGRWFRGLSRSARVVIVLFGGLALLTAYHWAVSLNVPYDDDVATLMVLGRDALNGNLALKGWTLMTQSFLTTELPWYMLGIALLGFHASVMYILSGVHWALIALLVIYLGATDEQGEFSGRRLIIATGLSALLGQLLVSAQFLSYGHLVAFIYGLLALLALRRAERTGRQMYYALLGILIVLAVVGDSFSLYFLAIPVALACLGRVLIIGPSRAALTTLGVTVVAALFGRGVLAIIQAAGGAQVPGLPANIVDMPELAGNLYTFAAKVLLVLGVTLGGHSAASVQAMLGLIHLAALAFFALALWRGAAMLHQGSLYMQALGAIVLLNIAENMLSGNGTGTRYYAPLIIFGIVWVTHAVETWPALLERRTFATGALLVLFLSYLQPLRSSIPATDFDGLGELVQTLHLKSGYAPYWRSHVLTVFTNEAVVVRPVYLRANGDLAPNPYYSNPSAYDGYADFVIVPDEDPLWQQITDVEATRVFGQPARWLRIPGYGTLMIWDHDISAQLSVP